MNPVADPSGFIIRDGRPIDLQTIVEFNIRLANETEGKTLDRSVIEAGVHAALADPAKLRYWVAESGAGQVIGQAAVSREWSDWRNGWIWWFQSVYVAPEARGMGVFRALHAAIRSAARQSDQVVGLRLYVEHDNVRAQSTYQALGMVPGHYEVFEEIWNDRS